MLDVAQVVVARRGGGFLGQGVEEAVRAFAAAGAEAVLPGGDFVGEAGEDCGGVWCEKGVGVGGGEGSGAYRERSLGAWGISCLVDGC